MNITLSIKHISEKYGLVYGTVRNHALQLFGRATGYFTEAEALQIVQNIKPRYKNSGVQNSGSNENSGVQNSGSNEKLDRATENKNSSFTNRNKIDQLLQRYNTLPLDDRLNIINTLMESSELKNRVNVLETEMSRRWEIEDAYTRRNIENMLPEVTDYGF